MRKKVVLSLFVGFIVYCLAVYFNDSSPPTSYFTADRGGSIDVPLSKEAAMKIAQKEVEYRANFAQNTSWPAESKIVDAFPVFMDGLEGVSYYECKVVTNGQDAGYILVNVNKNDLLIPENTQEGTTLTETYRKKLGRDDFMVLRYDWFRSVAVEKQSGLCNSRGKIIASIGFEEIDTPDDAIRNFRTSVLAKGCFPIYSKEELKEYYEDIQAEQANGYTIGWLNNAWAKKHYRDITAELKHNFEGTHHTPRWKQFQKSNGYSIGCGPCAWAIVYGYWAKCKNYNRLFDGDWSSSSGNIRRCMEDVARYCNTRDVRKHTGKMGYTAPKNMSKGINYAKNKGYRNSSCKRVREVNEFSKFDKIYPYIKADKPCILLLNESGFGFPNHYVVIEKATKRQRKRGKKGSWKNRDVFFTVNIENGRASKEIWTREKGGNDHKHYSTFDAYLIDVR